jgi:hypothetical protein
MRVEARMNEIVVDGRSYAPTDSVPLAKVRDAYVTVAMDMAKAVLGPRFEALRAQNILALADALDEAPEMPTQTLVARVELRMTKEYLRAHMGQHQSNAQIDPGYLFRTTLQEGARMLASNVPVLPHHKSTAEALEQLDAEEHAMQMRKGTVRRVNASTAAVFTDDKLELQEVLRPTKDYKNYENGEWYRHFYGGEDAAVTLMALLIDEAKGR